MPSFSLYTSLMLLLLSMLVAAKARQVAPDQPEIRQEVHRAATIERPIVARVPLQDLFDAEESAVADLSRTIEFLSTNNDVQLALDLCDRPNGTPLATIAGRAARVRRELARHGVRYAPDISVTDCDAAAEALVIQRRIVSPVGRHG